MIPQRLAVVRALLLLGAAVLTVTVLPGMRWPIDLVLVLVVAVALRAGSQVGALFGLTAGLLIDLLPPGSTPLGLSAVLYAGIGAAIGLANRSVRASVLVPSVGVLLAVATMQTLRLGAAFVSRQPIDLGHAALVTVVTAMVGALVVPPLMRLESYLHDRGMS